MLLFRYFASSIEGLEGRAELLGCLKGGTYSQSHVGLSRELALANPEITLPLFCGESLLFFFCKVAEFFFVLYCTCMVHVTCTCATFSK